MKVFVQIVDTRTGGYQCEMIDEPVEKGFEVANALKHFGINDINWTTKDSNESYYQAMFGKIDGTTKVVSVITIQVVSDQPSF